MFRADKPLPPVPNDGGESSPSPPPPPRHQSLIGGDRRLGSSAPALSVLATIRALEDTTRLTPPTVLRPQLESIRTPKKSLPILSVAAMRPPTLIIPTPPPKPNKRTECAKQVSSVSPTVVRPSPSAPSLPSGIHVQEIRARLEKERSLDSAVGPTVVRPTRQAPSPPGKRHSTIVDSLRSQLESKLDLSHPPTIVRRTHPAEEEWRRAPGSEQMVAHVAPTVLLPVHTPQNKSAPARPPPPRSHSHSPNDPNTEALQSNEPQAMVCFDFSGSLKDELSSLAGDVILLREEVDADWVFGWNGRTGAEGIMPRSFLDIRVPLAAATKNVTVASREDSGFGADELGDVPRCLALYDFNAEAEGDLSLRQGETVYLTGRQGQQWLEGETLDRRQGIFPANFVEILQDLPPDSSPEPLYDSAKSATDGAALLTALFDYQTGNPDDLHFKEGDGIFVLGRINAEWLFGSRAEDERVQGMFPESFVADVPGHLPLLQPPRSLVGRMVRAEFDYRSEDSRDLNFEAGDRIRVLGEEGEWLSGQIILDLCNTRFLPTGMFPRNFVQLE